MELDYYSKKLFELRKKLSDIRDQKTRAIQAQHFVYACDLRDEEKRILKQIKEIEQEENDINFSTIKWYKKGKLE